MNKYEAHNKAWKERYKELPHPMLYSISRAQFDFLEVNYPSFLEHCLVNLFLPASQTKEDARPSNTTPTS